MASHRKDWRRDAVVVAPFTAAVVTLLVGCALAAPDPVEPSTTATAPSYGVAERAALEQLDEATGGYGETPDSFRLHALNTWCADVERTGSADVAKMSLEIYTSQRLITPAEEKAIPAVAAAQLCPAFSRLAG